MSDYQPKAGLKEWSKWLVYTMARPFGYQTPAKAMVAGLALWFVGWGLVPGARTIPATIPFIRDQLPDWGITPRELLIVEVALIVVATIAGLGCWCRVAQITMPNTFERHKIKNIDI